MSAAIDAKSESKFAERLRALRTKNGLSGAELSNEFNLRFNGGLSRQTISRYELAKQVPLGDTVRRLAEFFDVSIAYLLGSVDTPGHYESLTMPQHQMLGEEESELLRIFSLLGVKGKHTLLSLAFKLEEEALANQHTTQNGASDNS